MIVTLKRQRRVMNDGWIGNPDQTQWVKREVPAGTKIELVRQYDGGANTAYNHPWVGRLLDGTNDQIWSLFNGTDF